jgi:hypothetical protein
VHRDRITGDALYIAWKLDTADAAAASRMQDRLEKGHNRKLYRLRSWVIVNGEARALLAPEAPLEEITEAIWPRDTQPLLSRWIAGRRACAETARQIEQAPVALGLARRPEQWPYSSASWD